MSLITDLSFQRILYQLCGAVVILASHGYLLALAAKLLGDSGPQYDQRLTLNPFSHAEPIGAFALILTQMGWVRPIALEPRALWGGAAGPLLVALAALVGSSVLGWCLWQLRPVAFSFLGGTGLGITVVGLLETMARMSLSFVIFNLIPILPLSAGHILIGIVPRIAAVLKRHQLIVSLVLGVAIMFGGALAMRQLVQVLSPIIFQ